MGLRIRDLREARFLTQADLAKRAGVGVVTISRLERDLGIARFTTIRKLAEALGVEPAELVVRE